MLHFAREFFRHPLSLVMLWTIGLSFVVASRRAELSSLREQRAQYLSEWAAARQELGALRDERNGLLTDAAAIEAVAREQYGFAKRGEISTPFDAGQLPAPAPLRVALEDDPWERVLGRGGFPVLVPLAVLAVSAAVLAFLESLSAARAADASE